MKIGTVLERAKELEAREGLGEWVDGQLQELSSILDNVRVNKTYVPEETLWHVSIIRPFEVKGVP